MKKEEAPEEEKNKVPQPNREEHDAKVQKIQDEIDKLTHNSMFNPSGALLELLDPEQNNTFKDRLMFTVTKASGSLSQHSL